MIIREGVKTRLRSRLVSKAVCWSSAPELKWPQIAPSGPFSTRLRRWRNTKGCLKRIGQDPKMIRLPWMREVYLLTLKYLKVLKRRKIIQNLNFSRNSVRQLFTSISTRDLNSSLWKTSKISMNRGSRSAEISTSSQTPIRSNFRWITINLEILQLLDFNHQCTLWKLSAATLLIRPIPIQQLFTLKNTRNPRPLTRSWHLCNNSHRRKSARRQKIT